MLTGIQEAQVAKSHKVPAKCQKVYVLITQAKGTEGGAVKGPMKVCSSSKLNDHWTDSLTAPQEEDEA